VRASECEPHTRAERGDGAPASARVRGSAGTESPGSIFDGQRKKRVVVKVMGL
jgi:hypothetical protein